MQYAQRHHRNMFHYFPEEENVIQCNRGMIKSLLLQQWRGLTNAEIESTHYIKTNIAELIERRYGIHQRLAENYLTNLERTLPLQ